VKKPAIEHLSADMKRYYGVITRKYALLDQHQRLLIAACESHDRMTAARDRLAVDGLVIVTRHGETRAHPCCAIERDSRVAFVRCMRELGLSDEATPPRPPRLTGRYAGRG
jgi:P27 family predicted phage terminase small subunit